VHHVEHLTRPDRFVDYLDEIGVFKFIGPKTLVVGIGEELGPGGQYIHDLDLFRVELPDAVALACDVADDNQAGRLSSNDDRQMRGGHAAVGWTDRCREVVPVQERLDVALIRDLETVRNVHRRCCPRSGQRLAANPRARPQHRGPSGISVGHKRSG